MKRCDVRRFVVAFLLSAYAQAFITTPLTRRKVGRARQARTKRHRVSKNGGPSNDTNTAQTPLEDRESGNPVEFLADLSRGIAITAVEAGTSTLESAKNNAAMAKATVGEAKTAASKSLEETQLSAQQTVDQMQANVQSALDKSAAAVDTVQRLPAEVASDATTAASELKEQLATQYSETSSRVIAAVETTVALPEKVVKTAASTVGSKIDDTARKQLATANAVRQFPADARARVEAVASSAQRSATAVRGALNAVVGGVSRVFGSQAQSPSPAEPAPVSSPEEAELSPPEPLAQASSPPTPPLDSLDSRQEGALSGPSALNPVEFLVSLLRGVALTVEESGVSALDGVRSKAAAVTSTVDGTAKSVVQSIEDAQLTARQTVGQAQATAKSVRDASVATVDLVQRLPGEVARLPDRVTAKVTETTEQVVGTVEAAVAFPGKVADDASESFRLTLVDLAQKKEATVKAVEDAQRTVEAVVEAAEKAPGRVRAAADQVKALPTTLQRKADEVGEAVEQTSEAVSSALASAEKSVTEVTSVVRGVAQTLKQKTTNEAQTFSSSSSSSSSSAPPSQAETQPTADMMAAPDSAASSPQPVAASADQTGVGLPLALNFVEADSQAEDGIALPAAAAPAVTMPLSTANATTLQPASAVSASATLGADTMVSSDAGGQEISGAPNRAESEQLVGTPKLVPATSSAGGGPQPTAPLSSSSSSSSSSLGESKRSSPSPLRPLPPAVVKPSGKAASLSFLSTRAPLLRPTESITNGSDDAADLSPTVLESPELSSSTQLSAQKVEEDGTRLRPWRVGWLWLVLKLRNAAQWVGKLLSRWRGWLSGNKDRRKQGEDAPSAPVASAE